MQFFTFNIINVIPYINFPYFLQFIEKIYFNMIRLLKYSSLIQHSDCKNSIVGH